MLRIKTWIGKNKLASLGLGFVGIITFCCVCLFLLTIIIPPSPRAQNEAVVPQSTPQHATAGPTAPPRGKGTEIAPPVATLDVMATATFFAAQVEQTQTAEALSGVTEVPTLDSVYGTAKNNLNARSGPGANYAIVGKVLAGERVEIIAASPDRSWLQHNKGWSAAEFLTIEGDVTQLDIVEAVSPFPTDTPPAAVQVPPETLPTTIPPNTLVLPTIQTSGKFVASSEARKYYYCETDESWKGLSVDNLIWSDDESVFINRGLELHEPC